VDEDMENKPPFQPSSTDIDRDQPVVLIATLNQLAAAGMELAKWQPATAELAQQFAGCAARNVFVHRELAAPAPSLRGKPAEADALLNAEDFAKRMECSPQAVYHREQARQFFSVIPPGRTKGRKYPAFQLDRRLDRSSLHKLIVLFKEAETMGITTNDLWNFLRTIQSALQGNTVLNALLGVGQGASKQDDGQMIFELAEEEITVIS
jgi:hypothetical protein